MMAEPSLTMSVSSWSDVDPGLLVEKRLAVVVGDVLAAV